MSARDFDSLTQADHDKPLQSWRHDEAGPVACPDVPASHSTRDDDRAPSMPVARGAGDWPEPDMSLLGGPRQLPAFPLDVLPPPWRDWSRGAAQHAAAPLDYVALSLLTAGAGLIGGARRVSPVPSWAEPCVLWTALVGAPASGKTRAQDTALDLLRALERAAEPSRDIARRDHAAWTERARCRHRVWKQKVHNTAMCTGALPPDLPEDALAPPPPCQIVTDEPAVDAVVETLRGNPRGVLLSNDADGDWLRAMTRNVRAGAERRFWQAAWSGRPCTAHHRRLLPIDLARPAVSILGALPPEAIGPALAGDGGGMAGRCLFAWPQRAAYQPLSIAAGTANADLLATLDCLHELPDEPRDVPLAGDALAAFESFRLWHHEQAGAVDACEAGWWGHGPGMVLRLAGVLTFLRWAAGSDVAEPEHIPVWAIRSAVELWQGYLWPHAQAVLRSAGGSERQRRLEKVLRWVAAQGLGAVSREQVRREALGQGVDAAGADAVIADLIAAGWLRPAEREKTGPGRPGQRWLVNPELEAFHTSDDPGADSHGASRATPGRKARPEAGESVSAIPAAPSVAAPHEVFPLPPCGGGSGRGVPQAGCLLSGIALPNAPSQGRRGSEVSAIPAARDLARDADHRVNPAPGFGRFPPFPPPPRFARFQTFAELAASRAKADQES